MAAKERKKEGRPVESGGTRERERIKAGAVRISFKNAVCAAAARREKRSPTLCSRYSAFLNTSR